MDANQQDQIAQFAAITGANPSTAQGALEASDWNLQEAVSLYFAENDENFDNYTEPQEMDPSPGQAVGPDTAPAQPSSSSSSSTRKPPTQRPKHMTLDDLKKIQEQADDDDEEDKPQDMFAGGEKSALAVQNPNQGSGPTDHFRNIMNQARQNRDRPAAVAGEEPEQPGTQRSSNFMGRAQTLGGDDAPSEVISDPTTAAAPAGRPQAQGPERVNRTLHLWADGVSIDDGPLFRFDDPANANIMAEINRGRAPLALLDVQPDQEVDLNLEPHKDENYVQPKRKYKPFGGSGQRLGSPTPGPAPSSSIPTTATAPTTAAPPPAAATTQAQIDESQPSLQLQIRLGDGTRLQSRFNTTQTIGDVYAFVDRASSASTQRAYALMTTFPSKELSDRSVVLGEMGEFKRGGVVVQKWK